MRRRMSLRDVLSYIGNLWFDDDLMNINWTFDSPDEMFNDVEVVPVFNSNQYSQYPFDNNVIINLCES